jgi:hypothetical protein
VFNKSCTSVAVTTEPDNVPVTEANESTVTSEKLAVVMPFSSYVVVLVVSTVTSIAPRVKIVKDPGVVVVGATTEATLPKAVGRNSEDNL